VVGRRRIRRGWVALVTGALLAVPALAGPQVVHAQVGGATPSSGTVGPGNGSKTTWAFDPIVGAGSGGTPIENVCAPGQCSQFSLTVKLPQADSDFYQHWIATLTYRCSWNDPTPTDVDCFTFSPSGAKQGPGKPDNTDTASFEELTITDPQSGVWTLKADEAAGASTTVTGVATLTFAPVPTVPVQTAQKGDPRFANFDFDPAYQKTDALNRPDAGEPSLGVDRATGAVMYMAGNQVTHLDYSAGGATPPKATDVTPPESQVNEDAILFTDPVTNRTWALGLLLAGSYMSYTDDDGANWTPGAAFAPPAMPDHETLGSGPYHDPAPTHSYDRAVYYCAQTIVQDAYCGRSDDGGMTFSAPATPLWGTTCSPIHGHVRVGPTGNVYVPNDGCHDDSGNGRSGIAVSVDNGQSFTVQMPPDSSPGGSDPSVMEGPDHVVYFGYQASNGHPMMATATYDPDGTMHWRPSVDVGALQDPGETEDGLPFGVQNTEFSEVIAGDPGRAAFAFLGTGRPGGDQGGDFQGTWYLFVSYTYDGGKTWRTVNATPNDPVQRGCIWNGGLVNACRNMLDFNDIGIDTTGHVYVAYTDGCTTTATYSCDKTPGIHGWNDVQTGDQTGCGPSEVGSVTSTSTCTFARLSAVVRQVCGRGLVAASDPGFNEAPECAQSAGTTQLSASASGGGAATPPAVSLPNTSSTGAAAGGGGLAILGAGGLMFAVRRRRRRA
jgi:LPXTG-motif cell wall-anchored protein